MSEWTDRTGKRVVILSTTKTGGYKNTVNRFGTIVRDNRKQLAVEVDDMLNMASSIHAYWYKEDEIGLLEDMEMTGYNKVAIAKLLEDVYQKDYTFALFDEEDKLLTENVCGKLVVVNAGGKNKHKLAVVQEVKNVEDCNGNGTNGLPVTAEVVGVVITDGYDNRAAEAERKKKLEKERKALEEEVRSRVSKLNNIAMYEKIANEYKDVDPGLLELVEKLKTFE